MRSRDALLSLAHPALVSTWSVMWTALNSVHRTIRTGPVKASTGMKRKESCSHVVFILFFEGKATKIHAVNVRKIT